MSRMLGPSAFRNRHRNSGRQHEGKRFPSHLSWLRKRPCVIEGKQGHICEGRMEAMHVDEAGGKSMGCKVADFHACPGCSAAHSELHRTGSATWQAKYGVNLVEAARSYAKASPHRHLWETANG